MHEPRGPEDSDEELISLVAAGDADALRLLYERHSAAMLRLIRRLTSRHALAEEILQEAWLAVWRSAPSYRQEGAARAWLFGVARRQAHNTLRRTEPPMTDVADALGVPDPGPAVEEQVFRTVEQEELIAAVKELPEHLHEVLSLVLVDDLPYSQVAAVLGVPTGTVKSRMSTARRHLLARLTVDRPGGVR